MPQIDEDMRRIATSLQATFPATNEGLSMNAIAAHELIVGDVRRPLLILLGAVGFVLLVACTNLAHLMLARASTRQTELAVRAALGAGRSRLVRQLLTEATVLGLLGGVAGLVLAYLATEALVAARPADIPRLDEITVDGTAVLFTLGLALVAGLAFGVLPALQASGHRICRGLRGDARTGGADLASELTFCSKHVLSTSCNGHEVWDRMARSRRRAVKSAPTRIAFGKCVLTMPG